MRRRLMIMMCLLAMMAAGTSAKAQQVTITLMPGWNWISYPNAVSMDINEALGDFAPLHGDRLKSSEFSTEYDSDWGWFGDLETFEPGQGYMYYSARTEATSFVFVHAPSSLVTTGTPTDITITSAVVSSTLNLNEGNHIFARGVCWDTVPNPTIDGSHIAGDNTASSQSYTLDGLSMGATYYVRAYVAMDYGLVYGEQKVFSTRDGIPVLTTADITDMGTSQVTCGGEVTDDGGLEVTARGVCWSTSPNPTIADAHTTDDAGMGEFVSTLTGLEHNTTYYVRAYATNSHTTAYGEEVTFIIDFVLATVTTDEASWVTTTTAIVGGQFSYVGNCVVTDWGICYRTEGGTETCVADSTNANPFTMELTGLLPNTTYIVRAYAINRAGTSYGEEKTFTTLEEPPAFPNGAIDGKFTVNAYNGQVYFSQGNLQYIGSAAEPYWKFADYQWYHFGETTGQNSANEDVDRDLFGWGTSGYSHGAVCYQPWSTSTNNSSYYAYGNSQYNLYDQTDQADWGYNAIANGGNQENSGWRTLTKDEWYYVFNTRPDAASKYGHGSVNGVNGMVLLPDEWTLPEGLSFTSGNSNWANVYTAEQWAQMEANGAVFLPASGYRHGTSLIVDFHGWYWTSSHVDSNVYNVEFYGGSLNSQHSDNRYDGNLVRLVRNTVIVPPSVTTLNVNSITNTTAIIGGQITDYGGVAATEYGICYRTEQGEETCVAANGINDNTFWKNLQDLTPNTTYIVRAYATNGEGTSYGEEMSFTTLEEAPTLPQGIINGLFTINSNDEQVYFSQGNLQYTKSTHTWSFMEHQYDVLGTNGQNVGDDYANTDIVSYFGWGTSGCNLRNTNTDYYYQPYNTLDPDGSYYGTLGDNDLIGDYANGDWGVYNPISNGGNAIHSWRTLSKAEWDYVFEGRTNASSKWGRGNVEGVNGVVLLPDIWAMPIGLTFIAGTGSSFETNTYTEQQWTAMQTAGAVFLPAAGWRRGPEVASVNDYVMYWTVSSESYRSAYNVWVTNSNFYGGHDSSWRHRGLSVRLVRNAAIAPPTVTTHSVMGVTSTTAIVGGQITDYGGVAVTEYGICYRTEQGEETCVAANGINDNTFWKNLQDLTPNTTYIVRAYATNDEGTGYGEEVTFTTLDEGNEHEYVDLGLPSGLLWATCNVGADTPEEYGDYFAWGETTPKDVYNWSTYLYCNGTSSTLTKYTESDGLTILQPEDDAATANWGNDWRMPTKEEWQELYQSTTHVWTTQNGVHGRLFTGSNGNSLFLPAAGSYDGSSLTEGGVCGSYWASSLRIPQFAWDYYFGSGHSYMGMGGTRFYGESVRAVRNAE